MAELTTDTETDQLIWFIIQKSKNTNDHIAFIGQHVWPLQISNLSSLGH